ncbi:LOW QUALITY PROTEIN: hypothetical protein OSB04_006908 [Centaurea solstitialis]|uniref:Nitrate regulatory gene2 protein n=1 Tax=Centaurea solstitialis TaxID=347529 RepID=A0AA38TIU1_9ASTR|nr:LOW QUALITY PROTEIN: hypothetical protein OSB04_006908 [Centaurea solstitialis]
MGCAMSFRKSGAGDDNDDDLLVSVCRERKRLMKSAVERRYALAGAHSKYNQSLYAVALALRLFVARHSSSSSSSSQFLIAFDSPSKPLTTTTAVVTTTAAVEVEEENSDDDDEGGGVVCEHFYDDGETERVGPTTPGIVTSSVIQQNQNDDFVGWDFFNPFDNFTVGGGGGQQEEEKGIKVEEVKAEGGGGGGGVVAEANVSLGVIDDDANPGLSLGKDDGDDNNNGRELLEALKDVEDHFLKAYESGVEFSKLLEFTNMGPLDHLDSKECSEKLIPSITWHKSSLTTSPSCRSLLSSSSRSSTSWTRINSNADLFDEATGMESGSHLSTLGRLFAWEKKLYDEVKAGNEMKKIYDRKSSQLSTENASNKPRIEDQVNDLYSRLMVSIKICDSISKRIEKVRDDELQPQLIELLHGLTKTWKVMLELHKTQSRTMFEVKEFPSAAALTNDRSRHLATLQLEAEIQNWRICFSSYIAAMGSYIEALSEWAYRTIPLELESGIPPLVFALCRDWLTVTKSLPDKAVTYAMKRFAKDLRTLWAQQGIELQQKRKVDRLVAESEKRVVSFEKEERNIVSSKPMNMKNKVDVLAEKKAQLDGFTKMVETEKAKHKDYVEETRRVILVGFQTGFTSVFDSLAEFSEVCVRKYDDVVQNATSGRNLISGC